MYTTVSNNSPGSIEFDDRGNARWVASTPVNSDETLLRILDIGWMQVAPDEAKEVRRDGFDEVFRSGA